MAIDPESLENFHRAGVHDAFLGVIDIVTDTLYLALVKPRDAKKGVDPSKHSTIKGKKREPLPGSGGHSMLAGWVGIEAQQLQKGIATGKALGFSLIKKGPHDFTVGTFRSGLNRQYQGERPAFTQDQCEDHQARTLEESQILNRLLPQLTAGLLDTKGHRASVM